MYFLKESTIVIIRGRRDQDYVFCILVFFKDKGVSPVRVVFRPDFIRVVQNEN